MHTNSSKPDIEAALWPRHVGERRGSWKQPTQAQASLPMESSAFHYPIELPVTFLRGTLCYKIDSEHVASFCQRQAVQESWRTSHCFPEPGLCAQCHRADPALLTSRVMVDISETETAFDRGLFHSL